MYGIAQAKGRKLVIVRYKPSYNVYGEWVYNKAHIDGAEIVWAREMSRANDASLLQYFRSRKIFLLRPDEIPVQLRSYFIVN